MTGKLNLKELPFGIMNNISDGGGPSTDRRRTDPLEFLRLSTENAYGRDALRNKETFEGIVVSVREITFPSVRRKGDLFKEYTTNKAATSGKSTSSEKTTVDYPSVVYKVFIPELEPRPAPRGTGDPILATYPDVYSDIASEIAVGNLVRVTYEDVENLYNPRIVAITGGPVQIEGFVESAPLSGKAKTSTSVPAGNYQADRVKSSATKRGPATAESCPEAVEKQNISIPSINLKGKFSFDDLKVLTNGPFAASGFLDWIGKGEGNPNSVNRGVGGDSPGAASKYIIRGPLAGKNLTQLTFAEVYSLMEGKVAGKRYRGPNAGAVMPLEDNRINQKRDRVGLQRGFLAVGKMQFIPNTLNGAMNATRVARETTLFSEESQLVLGVYLIMGGQGRRLGTYLLGYHDNVGEAGQNLAEIWASVPVQFQAKNGCKPGYSRYCKGGANSTKPLRKTTCEAVDYLKRLREAIKQDSNAMALIQKRAPQGSFVV